MDLLYIVGEPGVGKSTLVKSFTEPCHKQVHDMPVLHTEYSTEVAQIGQDREDFGGTDTLGYMQPIVQMWLNRFPYPFMLAEGDRLNNSGFFDFCIDAGINLTVMSLWAPELAAERRAERAEKVGKAQKEWWLKTRRTKVENVMEQFCDDDWIIDGTLPFEELRELMRRHPVIQAIERAAEDAFDVTTLKTYHELTEELYLQPQYEGGPTRVRRRRGPNKKRKDGTRAPTAGHEPAEGALTAPKVPVELEEVPLWQRALS